MIAAFVILFNFRIPRQKRKLRWGRAIEILSPLRQGVNVGGNLKKKDKRK